MKELIIGVVAIAVIAFVIEMISVFRKKPDINGANAHMRRSFPEIGESTFYEDHKR